MRGASTAAGPTAPAARAIQTAQCTGGKFIAGRRAGVGTALFGNGASYAGLWDADERHGAGTLRMADGREISGVWQRGVLHGNDKAPASGLDIL